MAPQRLGDSEKKNEEASVLAEIHGTTGQTWPVKHVLAKALIIISNGDFIVDVHKRSLRALTIVRATHLHIHLTAAEAAEAATPTSQAVLFLTTWNLPFHCCRRS